MTSVTAVGRVVCSQVVPPFTVVMATPWVPCPCPMATHWRRVLQAMAERKPTVAGTAWTVQVMPPLLVAMMAAPLGAPSEPTVDPTAQQSEAVAQVTAAAEFTGRGRATGTRDPDQGEPDTKVLADEVVAVGREVPVEDDTLVQPATQSTATTMVPVVSRRTRLRPRVDTVRHRTGRPAWCPVEPTAGRSMSIALTRRWLPTAGTGGWCRSWSPLVSGVDRHRPRGYRWS